MKLVWSISALALTVVACESPGSGGRGGVFPTTSTSPDTVGGDTSVTTSTDTGGSGDTTTATGTTGTNDTSTGDTVVIPDECNELPLSGSFPVFTSATPGTWTSPQALDLGLGGSAPDAVMIQLGGQTGNLALEGLTPSGCSSRICIFLTVDVGAGGTTFFANDGTAFVAEASSSAMELALTDVTLVELTANFAVVPNGDCLHVNAVTLSGESEVTCEPDCGGRECGSDGCEGSCGNCGVGETCNASGQCVGGTPGACTTLSPSGDLVGVQPGLYGIEITSLNLGGAEQDFFELSFFTEETGSFNLATAPNDDYATCEQCIRIFEDDDGAGSATIFYQSKGTLVISGDTLIGADPPTGSFTLTNVELVEVDIDPDTFESTPVSGGRCYKISNRTLSTP